MKIEYCADWLCTAWFQNVDSMLNHHLAGLLGLGSLSWAGGHQDINVSLPINRLLDAGVDPKEITTTFLASLDICVMEKVHLDTSLQD